MKKHALRANVSGLNNFLGQAEEALSEGASFLFMATRSGGAWLLSESAALASWGRIRGNRGPRKKCRRVPDPSVTSMGHAFAYFRKVMKEPDDALALALAK